MKNYKQILEAINRSIKFALDDFDNQEDIQGLVNNKVNNKSNLKEYLEWNNLISKLEDETLSKQDIKELARIYKILNIKYIVNSKNELKHIIKYIDNIDHKTNLNWIDTSEITDMYELFKNLKEFNSNISEWDVSNVT